MARAGAIVARRPGPVNHSSHAFSGFSHETLRYDMVSIERLLSLGAHDLEAVALPIHLRMKLAADYCGGTAEIVSWPF